ncbi:MAG: hypothetical protein NVSMB30_31290 [Hymenobacter sp.]
MALASPPPAPGPAGVARAYPNPSATGHFAVEVGEPLQGDLSYTLRSALGAVVARGTLPLRQPTTVLTFDFSVPMGAAGLYYLRLDGSPHPVQLKLQRP